MNRKQFFTERWSRSLVKAVTYRIIILILDFAAVYLLTGKIEVAFGFMLVSNVYTTLAYLGHERLWNGITWGKTRNGSALK